MPKTVGQISPIVEQNVQNIYQIWVNLNENPLRVESIVSFFFALHSVFFEQPAGSKFCNNEELSRRERRLQDWALQMSSLTEHSGWHVFCSAHSFHPQWLNRNEIEKNVYSTDVTSQPYHLRVFYFLNGIWLHTCHSDVCIQMGLNEKFTQVRLEIWKTAWYRGIYLAHAAARRKILDIKSQNSHVLA